MISLNSPLSPTLAALLLKELPREEMAAMAAPRSISGQEEKVVIDRFYAGLEEHRLDLQSEAGGEVFCEVVLCYLEALLDPESDSSLKTGIEVTASSATTTWGQMTDIQRTVLWQEARALHNIIAPLANN